MRAKSLNSKLKAMLAGTLLMLGAFFAYSAINTSSADAAGCSGNSVITCGVWSEKEMRDKYNSDFTKGTQSIYAHMGITSDMVNKATVVPGKSYKNGEVKVNGKVVATNAYTSGRYYIKGSTQQKTKDGVVFYTRPAQVSMVTKSVWETFVFLDKNGKFIGAVLLDCGNPLQAKPVPPKPKPAYRCASLSRIKQSDPSKYVFVGKSWVANGAKHKGFTFDFGDGSDTKYVAVQRTSHGGEYGYGEVAHTYTKPGTYNVKVTAHFTVNGKEFKATSDNCQKPVTIPKKEVPPKPKNPGVSIDKQVRADESGMTVEEALEQARNFRPKGPCTTVMTPAVHLETGARYTFNSGCLPDGWVAERNYQGDAGNGSRTDTGWVEHAVVTPNEEFRYRLVVKNTGDVDLKNAVVRDAAPEGVTFVSADKGQIQNNVWTYTVPELKVGASLTVVITAKVTGDVATGTPIKNTACVDAKEVPGDKDDCDDATVEIEEPEMVTVCDLDKMIVRQVTEEEYRNNPERYTTDLSKCEKEPELIPVCDTKKRVITEVTEDELRDNPDRYTTDLSKCDEEPEVPEVPETPETPEVPKELPQTGLGLVVNSLAGIGTLTAATYYYVASRRM